jgi:hypothetical protein
MTRKLLMALAIVSLTLTPSIGIGTAHAHGFGGGGFHGGGFHGGGFHGGGFHGGGFRGRGFFNGVFSAGTVGSFHTMDTATRRTVTTPSTVRPPATDQAWLTAWRAGSSDTKLRDPPCAGRALAPESPRSDSPAGLTEHLGMVMSADPEHTFNRSRLFRGAAAEERGWE